MGETRMYEVEPYTGRDLFWAVNIAAILGWLVVAAPVFAGHSFGRFLSTAIVGLPIAFVVSWLIAAPILMRVMRKPISWLRAAVWGAVITGSMEAVFIAIFRFWGWRRSLNPDYHSRIGGGEYTQSIDGILTPYGWWVLAQRSAVFILAGVGIALAVRAVIGPGRR